LCAGAAGLAVAIFGRHPASGAIPIVFIAVVLLVALRFGTAVGILGSLAAAAVFAVFLFAPLGSLAVTDRAARSNLAWMLLAGTVISFLLAPSMEERRRH
jgi:K+-sensing histidine kinase KdpD